MRTASKDTLNKRNRRAIRTRAKISGSQTRPRLSVFRGIKNIHAQLIDDLNGKVLAAAYSREVKKAKAKKTEIAKLVGELLAKKAKDKKIENAVFDRRSYKYHGRIKALADGARQGGLKF